MTDWRTHAFWDRFCQIIAFCACIAALGIEAAGWSPYLPRQMRMPGNG